MKNLIVKFRTGRSKRYKEITSSKEITKYKYEITIVTDAGEFKESEWEDLVKKQAKEKFELDIIEKLKEYSLQELAWIKNDNEALKYALELYSNRIWENKNWVGYEKFNSLLKLSEVNEQISLI